MLIAHAGHWLVSLAYIIPVVAFIVWLAIATMRERRAASTSAPEEEEPVS